VLLLGNFEIDTLQSLVMGQLQHASSLEPTPLSDQVRLSFASLVFVFSFCEWVDAE
jgi:hypothetical protein